MLIPITGAVRLPRRRRALLGILRLALPHHQRRQCYRADDAICDQRALRLKPLRRHVCFQTEYAVFQQIRRWYDARVSIAFAMMYI